MHRKFVRQALFRSLPFFLIQSAALAVPPIQPPLPSPMPPVIVYVPPTPAPAPSVNPNESLPVAINYGQGQARQVNMYHGTMEPVGLLPNQSVNVTVALPTTTAGATVQLGPLDGGRIGSPAPPGTEIVTSTITLDVPATGAVQFNFQTNRTPGLYRVLMTVGGKQYLLQFYAARPAATH